MGSAEGDPRAMSKRTTAERNAIKRAKLAEAAAPPDFAVRTIESTEWRDGERYPRFILSTNSGSSGRPTPPRNF
jgi:hypothetical protein